MVTLGGTNAAQSDGGDIRFSTDSAGSSQIACEIVVWTQNATPASAIAEIWVPVDVLNASDVTIYVWYKAGGGLSQPAAGAAFGSQSVWNSHYKAVFHYGTSASLVLTDSTSNGNTLTNSNSATPVASQIDGGVALASASSQSLYKDTAAVPTGNTPASMQCWLKMTNNSPSFQVLGGWGSGSSNQRFEVYWDKSANGFRFDISGGGRLYSWTWDGNLHQFAILSGADTAHTETYIDATVLTAGGASGGTYNFQNTRLQIGQEPNVTPASGSNYWNGSIDEFRISDIKLDAQWIVTEYNNQTAPTSFLVPGSPSPVGGASGLFRVSGLSGIGSGGPFFSNPLN
jgi:hypothetical protein